MTIVRCTIFTLFILLLPFTFISAQHELALPDFASNFTYLNDQIVADTNANGTRKDMQRVYVLNRGGYYFISAAIDNNGYPLNIKASNGTGGKPIIFIVQNPVSNAYPGRFVAVDNSVWMKNLIISGIAEGDTTAFGHMPGGLFQTVSAGWDIVIDSCILTNSSGNHIRTDQAARVIKVTNTIFANMGYLGTSNLGAGKAFDLRNVSCDTLLLQNCSFINSQDRIVRHYQSTAAINHFIFDHNTIVNAMAYHGLLSLGWLGAEATITNNLFIDPFACGADTDAVRQVEFATNEKDPFGGSRMTWIFSDTSKGNSASTNYNIKNNYYAISDSGQALFTRLYNQPKGLPPEFNLPAEGAPLTWFINNKLGTDSATAFVKDNNIKLGNTPVLMTNEIDWYRSPAGGNKTKNTPTSKWNRLTSDFDRRVFEYYEDTLDCTYSNSLAAYTGAVGMYPAGDLNWFPAKLAEWLSNPNPTDVKYEGKAIIASYKLEQNYPNPFNPSTIIPYSLPKASHVTLAIYNALGQEVARLVNNADQATGRYSVQWNGRNSFNQTLASGIYFYQLRTDNSVISKKMVLLK